MNAAAHSSKSGMFARRWLRYHPEPEGAAGEDRERRLDCGIRHRPGRRRWTREESDAQRSVDSTPLLGGHVGGEFDGMTAPTQLVEFTLDDARHALALFGVDAVVAATAVTQLPGAPPGVCGVIDVRGRIVPVYDLRARFALPARPLRTDDQFIIARAGGRQVALLVDSVNGVITCPPQAHTALATLIPGCDAIAGVVKAPDGLTLIHDLEAFLSATEQDTLAVALADTAAPVHDGHP